MTQSKIGLSKIIFWDARVTRQPWGDRVVSFALSRLPLRQPRFALIYMQKMRRKNGRTRCQNIISSSELPTEDSSYMQIIHIVVAR
jgi:hypothetical protein